MSKTSQWCDFKVPCCFWVDLFTKHFNLFRQLPKNLLFFMVTKESFLKFKIELQCRIRLIYCFIQAKMPPSIATHLCFYSDVVQMLAWHQKPTVLGWVLIHLGITVTEKFSNDRQTLVNCHPETDKPKLLNTHHSCPSNFLNRVFWIFLRLKA